MRERYPEFQRAGLDVVAVVCQKREAVAAWLAADPMPFPVLIDDDRSRAKAWGVHVAISYDSWDIARPASFVVDTGGIVRYARLSSHQRDPAPIEEILSAP